MYDQMLFVLQYFFVVKMNYGFDAVLDLGGRDTIVIGSLPTDRRRKIRWQVKLKRNRVVARLQRLRELKASQLRVNMSV